MNIAYRVQSVPGREQSLARLLEYLPPSAEVIIDDGSSALGEWLVPPDGPWRGYAKVLSAPSEATHLCVLQDDCIPCEYFSEVLPRIVEARPESVICLFVPGSAIQTAHMMLTTSGAFCNLAFRDFLPVVAVLWPTGMARSFLEWTRTAQLPGMPRPPRADDAVAGVWKRATRADVICTIPSIVEHPDDQESTIGKRAAYGKDKGRIAAMSINGDPREIDWST